MPKTKQDQRREEQRERLWPGSEESVWKGPSEGKGYWCAPRVLPLLFHMTSDKSLMGKQDCSKVYLDLLSRDFYQGIVEIRDEEEHAFSSGYTTSRGRRTWQERIRSLEKAGFIKVAPKGNRSIGYILLLHPYQVVARLREEGKISDRWWEALQQQLRDVGAEPLAETPKNLRVIQGGGGKSVQERKVKRGERRSSMGNGQ